MKDYTIEEFSDLVCEKIEELKYEVTLTNPTVEDNYSELIELHTPLKAVNKTENAFPILSTFQISITCWNKEQRKAMQMTSKVETKLQELNFTRTNTSPSIYDPILQKYGITITFEVRYNSLTNAFNLK